MQDELFTAVQLALDDQWDAAHQTVQAMEDDPIAAWIHAVLHKIEGDRGNSAYWYRRAGKLEHIDDQPRAELTSIQRLLTLERS